MCRARNQTAFKGSSWVFLSLLIFFFFFLLYSHCICYFSPFPQGLDSCSVYHSLSLSLPHFLSLWHLSALPLPCPLPFACLSQRVILHMQHRTPSVTLSPTPALNSLSALSCFSLLFCLPRLSIHWSRCSVISWMSAGCICCHGETRHVTAGSFCLTNLKVVQIFVYRHTHTQTTTCNCY